MPECGHLIGHLAVPNKHGVLTYLPIRCNLDSGHKAGGKHDPDFDCRYLDSRSGMLVTDPLYPRVTVDERGCVVEA
jgi:hypothetical protein